MAQPRHWSFSACQIGPIFQCHRHSSEIKTLRKPAPRPRYPEHSQFLSLLLTILQTFDWQWGTDS
jgi:hypothetical protein